MDRYALPVVVTFAMLGVALGAAPVSAQAPSGTPYTPPGYSLTVPSTPVSAVSGTAVVREATPRIETQSIRGLWVPGLVGLPVSYVMTWVVANLTLPLGSSGVDLAYVPVLGPWLVLGQGLNGGDEAFYVTMGVMQSMSLVCLVLGLAIRLPKPVADAPTVSLRPLSATLQF
jgi:hypothetical protein